ncbi:MAG: hypothetical protein K9G33_04055 [Sneathiella sp.]|nr:hypothetical protein [Sneathiella sp.]
MIKSADSHPEIDELKEDLASLKKHVSELMASMKQDGLEGAEKIGAQAKEKLGELKDRGRQGIQQVEDLVKENPGQSIAIAFAAGFLASMLLRKRS